MPAPCKCCAALQKALGGARGSVAEHRCPVPCPPPSCAGLHVAKSGALQLGLHAFFPPFSPFSTHAGGRELRLGFGVSPGAPQQPVGWERNGHGSCLVGRAWAAPVLLGEKFACPPRAAGGCHRPCHLQGSRVFWVLGEHSGGCGTAWWRWAPAPPSLRLPLPSK